MCELQIFNSKMMLANFPPTIYVQTFKLEFSQLFSDFIFSNRKVHKQLISNRISDVLVSVSNQHTFTCTHATNGRIAFDAKYPLDVSHSLSRERERESTSLECNFKYLRVIECTLDSWAQGTFNNERTMTQI